MPERWVRVALVVVAAGAAVVGAWALLAPHSFYTDFPGGGRHWVSTDGPYNEHLVRDVGGLNLGMAVAIAVAAWTLSPLLIRTVLVAWLLFAAPHLWYHAAHLHGLEATSDKVAQTVMLAISVVVPIAVLALDRRRRAPA
jgi:hypothetical protein